MLSSIIDCNSIIGSIKGEALNDFLLNLGVKSYFAVFLQLQLREALSF